MSKEIGGYIELELIDGKHYHNNAIRLNSARSCLRHVIRAYNIKKLYTPYYTCPEVWTSIESEKCEIKFYNIDQSFMPVQEFNENDFILYTNYFGINSNNVKKLTAKYKNIIVDNVQGFFSKPSGIASIYSSRKFFGVPDGGYLICNKSINDVFEISTSYQRFSHLIKRIDGGSNFGYKDFQDNEDDLGRGNIKQMSNLTDRMLRSVNYESVKKIRIQNFNYLNEHLKQKNEYIIDKVEDDVPMFYPFVFKDDNLRNRLVENFIYVQCFWKNIQSRVKLDTRELYLQKYLFPLFVDQRYNVADMERMINIIHQS